jgi:hypothetical protein
MNEKLTLHFHGGTTAVATVTDEDLVDESARVEEFNATHSTSHDSDIVYVEELVESALTVPPRPRWAWIGDAFVFTQALCGVEYGVTQ